MWNTPAACVQMGTMAVLLPLGLKLVYLQELAHLNPLIPSQYWQLCKRIYQTLNGNSGKVGCTTAVLVVATHDVAQCLMCRHFDKNLCKN